MVIIITKHDNYVIGKHLVNKTLTFSTKLYSHYRLNCLYLKIWLFHFLNNGIVRENDQHSRHEFVNQIFMTSQHYQENRRSHTTRLHNSKLIYIAILNVKNFFNYLDLLNFKSWMN